MSQEIKHYCDNCKALISHNDWEDGLDIYGVQVVGSIELQFTAKTDCGRSGSPPTFINGGEFCGTKCAEAHLEKQIKKATEKNPDWVCGVTEQ
ncbi:hypothetical protein [Roseibium sp.]|uniref:hypothetical protein n=1 Tax=Roseibium sp. TaxID=1936156 RepID=UPI003B518530